MSKDIKAFPSHGSMGEVMQEGMQLRDYFAAKALVGMLTTCAAPALNGLDGHEKITAIAAYKLADAMLAARESKGE